MRLRAIATGAGVPAGDFTGRVREVFRRACLIEAESAGLITLAPAEAGRLPAAISIDLPDDMAFPSWAHPGREVAARAGILRVAGSGLNIDLTGAAPWRSNLAELAVSLDGAASRAAWEKAAALLRANGGAAELSALAGRAISALVAATRKGEAAEAGKSVPALVGLGAGGTPAGDDFLVGFLAALHAAGNTLKGPLGAAVIAACDRTNDVSAVYLRAAAGGEVSERLVDLAAALACRADPAQAARAALAVGHTSGADGVFGLLAGSAAIATAPLSPLP